MYVIVQIRLNRILSWSSNVRYELVKTYLIDITSSSWPHTDGQCPADRTFKRPYHVESWPSLTASNVEHFDAIDILLTNKNESKFT